MTYLSDKYNFTITPKLPKKEKENPPWNNLTLFNPERKVLLHHIYGLHKTSWQNELFS